MVSFDRQRSGIKMIANDRDFAHTITIMTRAFRVLSTTGDVESVLSQREVLTTSCWIEHNHSR
jgi:hypothetical protein